MFRQHSNRSQNDAHEYTHRGRDEFFSTLSLSLSLSLFRRSRKFWDRREKKRFTMNMAWNSSIILVFLYSVSCAPSSCSLYTFPFRRLLLLSFSFGHRKMRPKMLEQKLSNDEDRLVFPSISTDNMRGKEAKMQMQRRCCECE